MLNRTLFISTPNWFFTMWKKFWKVELTYDSCFKRKTYDTWVQSSIKETNQRVLEILWTVEGPLTSLWIRLKGIEALVLHIGKKTHLCLASSQTSQWNWLKSTPLNRPRNIILRILKEGWLRWKWYNRIIFLFEREDSKSRHHNRILSVILANRFVKKSRTHSFS